MCSVRTCFRAFEMHSTNFRFSLVSIGASFGLFLGVSVLSFVRLIYTFFIKRCMKFTRKKF